jgi:hypothetical protein
VNRTTGRTSLLVAVLAVALAIVGLALRAGIDTDAGAFIGVLLCIAGTFVGAGAVALAVVALAQRQRPRMDAIVGLVVGAVCPLIYIAAQMAAFLSVLSGPRGG